jgi:hypothetical protein
VIDKRQGTYNGEVSLRDWVIRLNLPENSKPKNIMVNGKRLELDSSDEAVLITKSELQEETMPFKGIGSKPRPTAGSILELTIHQEDVLKSIQISFTLE